MTSKLNVELDRELILKNVKEFLQENEELSPVEMMLEFCMREDLDISELADIISDDKHFKKYIETRCEHFRIFQ